MGSRPGRAELTRALLNNTISRTRKISNESTNQSWSHALAVYDSLVSHGWRHVVEFRNLVFEISRSEEASGLTAFTSHETLIVSPYTLTPDAFDGRHLRLHPLTDGQVRIDNYPELFARHQVETWTVPLQEARTKALSLLANL